MPREYTLTPVQMRAAQILSSNGLEGDAKTMQQIADELEIAPRTLFNWRQDRDFIDYKNELAEKLMDEFLDEAYRELKRIAIKGRQEGTRVKALELALKNRGKLTDVQKVEQTVKDERSNDEIEESLAKLQAQLDSLDNK